MDVSFQQYPRRVLVKALTGLLAVTAFAMSIALGGQNVSAATIMPGSSILSNGIASVPSKTATADGKYSVIAKLNDKSQLELLGDKSSWINGGGEYYFKAADGLKGKMGMVYTNIASYQGQELDLAIIATDWQSKGIDQIGFYTGSIGVATTGVSGSKLSQSAEFKYIYLNHNTHKAVPVNGFYTFNDLDWAQSIGFSSDFWSHVDQVYVPTTSTKLQYKKTANGSFIFEPDGNVGSDPNVEDDPNFEATIMYSGVSELNAMFSADKNNSPEKVLGTLSTSASVDYSAAYLASTVSTKGTMATHAFFGYSSYKPLRTATVTPAKTVSDSDESNVMSNTLKTATETNTWKITQVIPDEVPEFYYSTAYMTDNIDSIWNVKNVKVTNENGTDVTSWFNNQGAGNDYKLAVASDKLKSATFYGHTYTFTFNAVLKNGVDLDSYKTADGSYSFPNQGSFTTDSGTKPTNKVTTLLKLEDVNLLKTDASGKPLSGIKFALADTAANAKGGKYLKKDADGKVVYPSDSNYSSSLADYTVTTGADGKATWSGLSAAKDASQTYYYVELKTDASHQLLTGVGAAKSGPTDAAPTTTVTNKTKIQLPSTGSTQKKEAIVMVAVLMSVLVLAGISLRNVRISGGGY